MSTRSLNSVTLSIIPTLYSYEMDHHFDSIDCRISLYESWRQVPTLLSQIIPNNDIVFKIRPTFNCRRIRIKVGGENRGGG